MVSDYSGIRARFKVWVFEVDSFGFWDEGLHSFVGFRVSVLGV